jgi:haloalkane dehalogenase
MANAAGANSDWRSLFPFESHWLDLDGVRLHYVDQGEGSPLLMVHGNPTWSFYWRELITWFRESHRAVAIDHVWCGLSDKPAEYPYTLATHAENLLRFIQAKNLKDITLLAHDWGGAIGLSAACQNPDRFSRIVLFNTGAFPPPRVPWRIAACRLPWIGAWAVRGANVFPRAALLMATCRRDRMRGAVKRGILYPYDNWANRIGIHSFIRDIPLTRRHPTYEILASLEASLHALRDKPVQLIWGMRDWCFTPTCLERFIGIFPAAEVQRIERAGHWVVEDAYEQVRQLVSDFVSRDVRVGSSLTKARS